MNGLQLVLPKELTRFSQGRIPTLKEVKNWYMELILDSNKGNKTRSSIQLGISIRTLRNWDNKEHYSDRKLGKYYSSRQKMKAYQKEIGNSNKHEVFEYRCHRCDKLIKTDRRRVSEIRLLKERRFSCCPEHAVDAHVTIH